MRVVVVVVIVGSVVAGHVGSPGSSRSTESAWFGLLEDGHDLGRGGAPQADARLVVEHDEAVDGRRGHGGSRRRGHRRR